MGRSQHSLVIVKLRFIVIYTIPKMTAPWSSNDKFCDHLGNCLDFGAVLTVASFSLSFISLVKNVLERFVSVLSCTP